MACGLYGLFSRAVLRGWEGFGCSLPGPWVCLETSCSLTRDEIGICTAEGDTLVGGTWQQASTPVILNTHTLETCSFLASWANQC